MMLELCTPDTLDLLSLGISQVSPEMGIPLIGGFLGKLLKGVGKIAKVALPMAANLGLGGPGVAIASNVLGMLPSGGGGRRASAGYQAGPDPTMMPPQAPLGRLRLSPVQSNFPAGTLQARGEMLRGRGSWVDRLKDNPEAAISAAAAIFDAINEARRAARQRGLENEAIRTARSDRAARDQYRERIPSLLDSMPDLGQVFRDDSNPYYRSRLGKLG